MPDETQSQVKQARLLTVALELLRRSMTDSIAFVFANRDRGHETPTWARDAIPSTAPPAPSQEFHPSITTPPANPNKPAVKEREPVDRPATPVAPTAPPRPSGLWDDLPEIKYPPEPPATPKHIPPSGGFGLGAPDQSKVSAFDKPQAVIVVGPNPLPVKLVGEGLFKQGPTTPRAEREASSGGGMGSLVKALVGKFAVVFGPLLALSTILGQTNSGFGVFQKAISVLGASIAPLVLPFFAMLAAGILSVSDILWSKLLPALQDFYKWALKFGIPMAERTLEKTEEGIDAWTGAKNIVTQGKIPDRKQAETMGRNAVPEGDDIIDSWKWLNKKQMEGAAWLRRQFGADDSKFTKAKEEWWAGGKGPAKDEKGKAASDAEKVPMGQRFSANMRDVMRSLAMSIGPKASYTSLGEVGKQAQLAALNQDPIEAKLLRRLQETMEEWQKAWERKAKEQEESDQINRRGAKR